MSAQLDMFGAPAAPAPREKIAPAKKPTIEERFGSFVLANPHVMPAMLELARERLAHGNTRIGAKALWEELRQHLRVNQIGEWRLDNSYTALAARRLIELEPALADVIETRKRKAK